MFLIQPLGVGILAEFIFAFSVLIYGVLFKEKPNRRYVFVNGIGFVAFLITTELDLLVLPFLILYFITGILIAFLKIKWLYGIFGSLVYGSLLLSITLLHLATFQLSFDAMLSSLPTQSFFGIFYGVLSVLWLVTSIGAYMLSRIIQH